MARSTVRAARERFAELAPSLNPEMYRRLEDELKAAEQQASANAFSYADGRTSDARELGRQVLTDLCGVRDDIAALVREGEQGTISAKDFHKRLSSLRREQATLEGRAQDIVRAAEVVESIEDDPVAWTDNFYDRFPELAAQQHPDFSF